MSRLMKIRGMIDPHVHLRDMAWEHKADFTSETQAAIAGGYWAVFDMPNTPPETIDLASMQTKIGLLEKKAVCDWGVYAGASQTDNTSAYAQIRDVACGLKIFNNATTGHLLLDNQEDREKHIKAWGNERLIAVHAEGDTVADILSIMRQYPYPVHFLHISTAYEINLLREAKEEGLPVTIGVCPHHLYLTEADEARLGPYGIMKPSLKTTQDQEALWQALADDLVDVIESDHAPHSQAEKESASPPYGIPGLETTLALMVTAVHEQRLREEQLATLLATNAQRIWGLRVPDGTYTLIDLDQKYTIENRNLFTKCEWSPFDGMTVYGKVREVWIRGKQVFDGERILAAAGDGVNLFGKENG